MRAPTWVAAATVAAAPATAFAVDYLSAEQAARSIFPDADRFETQDITLDAAQMRKLDEDGVRARSARWSLRAAKKQAQTLGWVVIDEVIGKFELITYAVAIDAGGVLRQLEVLSYRESHGGEIRLPAWRRQFVGKRVEGPLRVGEDIANISGATLSCTHVTDGVRRIMAVLAVARADGLLP